MFDWDAVIIGGGPAGLTAGLYLSRAKRRTILLDKDTAGGYIRNIELIENYPGFTGGVAGAQLASQMVGQAVKYGLQDISLHDLCQPWIIMDQELTLKMIFQRLIRKSHLSGLIIRS